MSNFALVTCLKETPQSPIEMDQTPYKSRMARFLDFIKNRFRKSRPDASAVPKGLEGEIKAIELYEDTKAYLIHFPYDVEEISQRIEEITGFVNQASNQNDIKYIILSDELEDSIKVGWSSNSAFTGHILYLSLLVEILNLICSNRGIKIGDLDITIIHGKSNELYTLLSLLAPITKYMTICTQRRGDLECEINRIYDETGLSVGLSTEPKAALKNADVIINLDEADCINRSKLNSKALIINYNHSASKNITCGNVIINGAEVSLPLKLLQKLDKETLKHFKMSGLSEIILSSKTERLNAHKANEYDNLKSIYNEFKNDGYRISALRGRHSLLRPEQI